MRQGIVLSSIPFFMALIGVCEAAGSRLIDNFNDGKVTWTTWTSSDATHPKLTISTDAAEGKGSLLVEFSRSGFTTMACRVGLPAPGNCDAISFWIKRVSGNPGCDLQLEEDRKTCPEGIDCFRAPMPVPANDQWTRVVVPFKDFRYSYSLDGKGDGKLNPRRLGAFAIAAYQMPPFAFKIDCVEFVRLAEAADQKKPAALRASKNVFTGNTSFEVGTGSWSTDGTVDNTTAAVGTRSLKCVGASKACPTGAIAADRPYTLSFYAKARTPGTVRISVWMGYSHIIDARLAVPTTWTRLSVPLPPVAHPAGATFGFSSADPNEPIWLDGVQLEEGPAATAYEDPDPVVVYAANGVRSETIVLEDGRPLTLDVALFNSRCPAEALPLSLYYSVAETSLGKIADSTLSVDVKPGDVFKTTLTILPKMQPGYYTTRLVLRDRGGALLKEFVSPVAVVREPNAIAIDDSFFGMHTDGLWAIGAKPLHAIGVNWIRHGGALWGSVEQEKGKFNMPKGLAVIKEGFGALVTMLTVPPPAWAAGKDGFPASPDLIKNYIDKVLETYKDEITYYDFHNEPDLTLPAISGREKAFAALLRAAHPSFKAMGKKLAFDICGDAVNFAAEVMRNAPQSFDVFAPHPYSNPRYIGPGGMGLGPELGGTKERLEKCLALHRAQCPDREFWIGELGWGLDARVAVDSPWAVRHGAFLARSLLVARSFAEVKRYICFRDIGCVEGGHYEYGIWRDDDGVRPLPAVAAHATVAKLLDGAKPLPAISDHDIKIYAFTKDGRGIVAAWDSLDEDSAEPLRVEIPESEAEVWTMTGAMAPRGSDNSSVMIIGAEPCYAVLKDNAVDRVAARIRAAVQRRRPVAIALGLPDLTTLSLGIENKLTVPYAGRLNVAVGKTSVAAGLPVDIPAGGRTPVTIRLKTPMDLGGATVRCDLAAKEGGGVVSIQKVVPPMRVCRRSGQTLAEILAAELPVAADDLIVLDRRDQVLPADPTIGWKGPENLSARARVCWDDRYFYFLADVTDDVHVQRGTGTGIWSSDSIQMGIDTANDAQSGRNYDNNDYEYGFALGADNQTVIWRWQAPAGVAPGGEIRGARVVVKRIGTRTMYRVALPWRELAPLRPRPGSVFGFNFIVNDDDSGTGRNFWIGLTPGISEGKLPALFEKLVLVE